MQLHALQRKCTTVLNLCMWSSTTASSKLWLLLFLQLQHCSKPSESFSSMATSCPSLWPPDTGKIRGSMEVIHITSSLQVEQSVIIVLNLDHLHANKIANKQWKFIRANHFLYLYSVSKPKFSSASFVYLVSGISEELLIVKTNTNEWYICFKNNCKKTILDSSQW